jgi:hypothetical protein
MPKTVKKATHKSSVKTERRSPKLDDGTLPAPVRKAVAKTKRRSSNPNTLAKELMAEHMAKVEATQAPWQTEGMVPPVIPFAEQLSAHMRALGAKGGKIDGKRRLETMTEKQRKAVAMKAAAARWAKKRGRDE